MAKSFDELAEKTMTPAQRKTAKDRARELLEEMLISELRQLSGLTQADLAEAMGVSQPAVAKLERQDDIQVRTLHRLVEALGGELELVARFPKGTVKINQFKPEAA